MGVITKIEEQKNKNRVNIFVDDSFFCGLDKETMISFRLKQGKEVDESDLKEATFKSECNKAFDKAVNFISIRNHSKREITDKLLKKGFNEQVIEATLSKLEEYHYIDDEIFTKSFIEQNKNYSKLVLCGKLFQKGIDADIINKYLDNITDESEVENCIKVINKILKSLKIESFSDKQKLISRLSRRGYKIDVIKKALSELEIDGDFD